jgi:hypothetical protein
MSAAIDDDRFGLIELDLPSEALQAPAPRVAPAITPAPAPAPTALETGRASLLACDDDTALDGAVKALVRQYPDPKHAVRVALRPTYQALVRYFVVRAFALVWSNVFASLSQAVRERPALVRTIEPAGVQPGLVNVTARPHTGSYARYQGSWLGFIPHTGRAVRPGEHVTLVRRNGGQQTFAIGELVHSNYRTGGQVGSIVTFDADRPVQPATERQAIPVVTSAATMEAAISGIGSTMDALTSTLGSIASEAQDNASVASLGSMAGGQLRGVGFADAAGYVGALAHGVKQATADGYLSMLRGAYGYSDEQIAALTVTIIAETELPVDANPTIHMPTGPDIFTQRREAAAQLRRTADGATVAFAQQFAVDGATDPTAWWEIGWEGHGSITRSELIAACGRAPEPKVNETQLGRTMDSLRGTHDCALVTPMSGERRRWQIGRAAQHNATVGAEYGRVMAIVALLPTGELRYEGDTDICAEVRAKFIELTSAEVLRAGDVTAWLSHALRYQYGARKSAHNYLVPPERREAARELCTKVASVWARGTWVHGYLNAETGEAEIGKYVTDVASILGAILVAASAEVATVEQAWSKTVDDAKAKGNKVSARAAAGALARLDGDKPSDALLARVTSLAGVLGEGPLAPLRARVAALRTAMQRALDEAADTTSARAAMLELD